MSSVLRGQNGSLCQLHPRPGLTCSLKGAAPNATHPSAPTVTHLSESRPNILLLPQDTEFTAHFLAFHLSSTHTEMVASQSRKMIEN